MPTSDAAANAALDREVTAGGSWWLGWELSMPDEHLTTVADPAPIARVEIPRTAAFWAAADSRQVQPAADVDLSAATEDCTPVCWVFWDAEVGGSPQHCRRVVDVEIPVGASLTVPAETLTLIYP